MEEKGRPCQEYNPLARHDTRFWRVETQGLANFLCNVGQWNPRHYLEGFPILEKIVTTEAEIRYKRYVFMKKLWIRVTSFRSPRLSAPIEGSLLSLTRSFPLPQYR